jgi:hypothetical protein
MSRRPEELALPSPVGALLGSAVVEHPGVGDCRVVSGGGLVAKVGPAPLVDRELALLGASLPLSVPTLVDAGRGWLVTRAEADDDGPWSEDDVHGALADLARLHDAFEDAVPDGLGKVLRRPFTPEGADLLLEPTRRLGFPLPAPLARLLDDPTVLVGAAGSEPPTLLHGDPWPGNVLRPAAGRRVWVDWELASVGPAAADLASWLDQAPWHAAPAPVFGGSERGYRDDAGIYLAARSRPVERRAFDQARDAATVLWFLAYDVAHLAELPGTGGRRGSETVLTKALIAAEGLLSS